MGMLLWVFLVNRFKPCSEASDSSAEFNDSDCVCVIQYFASKSLGVGFFLSVEVDFVPVIRSTTDFAESMDAITFLVAVG
jgi:hypothetical protein